MTKELLLIVIVVFCLVKWCDGGECCWTNGRATEVWCDKYCCINMCCDNELLRKPASDREFICLAFFTSNLKMTKRPYNHSDILELAESLEEISKPTRRDEEHATIAYYLNILVEKFGKEGCMIVGSTAERTRVRTERDEADSDFIIISGKTDIPTSCLEYHIDCPCFVSARGKELKRYFNIELVDDLYLPADLLRNVSPEAFSLMRIINKALTKTVHAIGEHTPRDMIPRRAKVGTELKEYFDADVNLEAAGSSSTRSEVNIRYRSVSSKDYVPSFRLLGRPKGLDEWIQRKRVWPKEEAVRQIAHGRFFIVAKAALINSREDIDFCLSYSSAEKILFDEVYKVPFQRKCYLVIKAIHIAEFKQQNILKTFHWKTAFFWISEKRENWTEDEFLVAVTDILELMVISLNTRELQHFFINSNLFAHLKEGSFEQEIDNLISKLKRIQNDPVSILKQFFKLDQAGEFDVASVSSGEARVGKRGKRQKADKVGMQRIKEIVTDFWKEVTSNNNRNNGELSGRPTFNITKLLRIIIEVAEQVVDDGRKKRYFITPLEKPLMSERELKQISLVARCLKVPLWFLTIISSRLFLVTLSLVLIFWGFAYISGWNRE